MNPDHELTRSTFEISFLQQVDSHHTLQCSGGAMGEPARQENAAAKAGKSLSVPLTLKCGGEWGSTAARLRSSSGLRLVHQDWARAKKNRCWSLKPPARLDGATPTRLIKACSASLTPPRSAMFSPSVSLLLTATSSYAR